MLCVFLLITKIKTLSHEYNFVITSFGICPWRADIYYSNLIFLDKYLAESKYIGEIGLDKRFLKICGILHWSGESFWIYHFTWFNKWKVIKPTYKWSRDGSFEISRKIVSAKDLLFTWYAGDLEIVDNYLALGGYFSIGGEFF